MKETPYQKKWRASNPDKCRAAYKRWAAKNPARIAYLSFKSLLKNKYGISIAIYEAMVLRQHGQCAICQTVPRRRRLSIDHDHSTGKIRGLLCHECNTGLGFFRDSPWILEKAKQYVSKHSGT